MASERDQALNAVVQRMDDTNPNLETALSQAETQRLELAHKHEMQMKRAELGWFGRAFGSESHAAIVVAFAVILLGFGSAIGLWVAAWYSGHPEYWSSEAHIALAAATSALGYVFGRGSKDPAR